jgi:DNA-directed RNA polymerase subunit M/transcription elongation factor TFIIS
MVILRENSVGVDSMIYCVKCGNQMPDDNFFCGKCGHKVDTQELIVIENAEVEELSEETILANLEIDAKVREQEYIQKAVQRYVTGKLDIINENTHKFSPTIKEIKPNFKKKNEPDQNEVKNLADEQIKCPKCKSTQISAGNKGIGIGKAAVGGILLGPIGLLGGLFGSKTVMVTCLKCGNKWEAGSVT